MDSFPLGEVEEVKTCKSCRFCGLVWGLGSITPRSMKFGFECMGSRSGSIYQADKCPDYEPAKSGFKWKTLIGKDLYRLIYNQLDKDELGLGTKFYGSGTDRSIHKYVLKYSIAEFLLAKLYEKWEEEVLIEDLELWLSIAIATTNKASMFRYKYQALIEILKE